MSNLRILFIKPGDRVENQNWSIHHFARQLSLAGGFDVHFITHNFDFDADAAIRLHNIYPRLTSDFKLFKVACARTLAVWKAISEIEPDIIYVNNHIGALSCLIMGRMLRGRSPIMLDIRTLPNKKWKYGYYRHISRGFSHVFVLNSRIRDALVSNKNVSILSLGYSPNVFYRQQGSSGRRFHSGETVRCLYFGSIDKQRKLHRLVSAVATATDQGAKLRLTVIGSGNGRDELLEAIGGTGTEHLVECYDFMTQDQLRKQMWVHDLGICYVPNEGMYRPQVPLKAVEMLACGLPVVATDTEGNRQVIIDGENGFLVDDSPEGMAAKLKTIWEAGISKTIYKRTAASVKHLTWEGIVRRDLLPVLSKYGGFERE